jgi:protein-disulfide isomerase
MSALRFAALAAGVALALGACQKPAAPVTSDDMSMGPPAAKVTVVEYASVACPVCAHFNNEVFPAFKKKYVDSGRVRFVAREALTHDPALAAAGFVTARCAGKDKYFQVVDDIYRAQQEIETSGDPRAVLARIAAKAGVPADRFEACIRDPKALIAVNTRWEKYVNDDKITGTPTFVINGKVYDSGEMTLGQLDAAIAEAQAKP